MKSETIPPSLWLKNITEAVGNMIQEEIDGGSIVQGIIMTQNIYDKLSEAIGYQPNDWLGYVIEVLEQPADQDPEDGEDLIIIKGQLLN